jgi:hypothetical protein
MICTTDSEFACTKPTPDHQVFLAIFAKWNARDDLSFLLTKNCVNEWSVPSFGVGINKGTDHCIFLENLPRGLDDIHRRHR